MAHEQLLDLDPLTRWCWRVLERGLAAAGDASSAEDPPAATLPPLPDHLRGPLARHGFDAFDETALALALTPDLDVRLAAAAAAFSGAPATRYLTLAAIADLVGAHGAERVALAARLSEAGPLARVGLVNIVPPADAPVVAEPQHGPSMLATCVASTALLRWVFGVTRLEPALSPLVRDDLLAPAAPPDPACADALIARIGGRGPTLTSLVGGRPADALATALYAVARCGRPAITVEAAALFDAAPAARIAAEVLLRDAVVIVTGEANVPPCRWEVLSTTIVLGHHPTFFDDGTRAPISLAVRGQPQASVGSHLVDVLRSRGLEVPALEAERMRRWEHLRYEDVGGLAGTLTARAAGRTVIGDAAEVTAQDVTAVSVGIVGQDLARLATPLETSRDWTHLVLPQPLRIQLGELVDQATGRTWVLEEAGFGRQPGQPRGVTAVFAGPSGTGKTLAARLVAGELGLPLYAVNLAATVSKYIGETERNLDAVFAAAEQADAVLLFDEAEALFGKRSEVQDARDRYANLEIAFLLQRMERYEGVAILATNLLGHLDDAFTRRLSFCLHFPYPDEDQRSLIWRAVWPDAVRLADDLDLDLVAARHPLSGGHIRNIALAATYLARTRGGVVDAACVDRAIDREYAKLGQVPDALQAPLP